MDATCPAVPYATAIVPVVSTAKKRGSVEQSLFVLGHAHSKADNLRLQRVALAACSHEKASAGGVCPAEPSIEEAESGRLSLKSS